MTHVNGCGDDEGETGKPVYTEVGAIDQKFCKLPLCKLHGIFPLHFILTLNIYFNI